MKWLLFIDPLIYFLLRALRSKKSPEEQVKQLELPSIEVGQNLPVLFGTRMITSPRIAWYGDLKIIKIKADTKKKKG